MDILNEGLKFGDLSGLLSTKIHIDEYKSKMGDDDQIIVISFKAKNKEPAIDLVNFLETGYDYVLDADVSDGEIAPNQYLVFVEIPRRYRAVDRILEIAEETTNLLGDDEHNWVVSYGPNDDPRNKRKYYPLTRETLELLIPLSPKEYRDIHKEADQEIEGLQHAAGIKLDKQAPRDEELDALRAQAGQI